MVILFNLKIEPGVCKVLALYLPEPGFTGL